MGKGSFLIAGYNTSRNKEKYNEKRLCRVVGGGLVVITLVMAAWSIMGDRFPVAGCHDRGAGIYRAGPVPSARKGGQLNGYADPFPCIKIFRE